MSQKNFNDYGLMDCRHFMVFQWKLDVNKSHLSFIVFWNKSVSYVCFSIIHCNWFYFYSSVLVMLWLYLYRSFLWSCESVTWIKSYPYCYSHTLIYLSYIISDRYPQRNHFIYLVRWFVCALATGFHSLSIQSWVHADPSHNAAAGTTAPLKDENQ